MHSIDTKFIVYRYSIILLLQTNQIRNWFNSLIFCALIPDENEQKLIV